MLAMIMPTERAATFRVPRKATRFRGSEPQDPTFQSASAAVCLTGYPRWYQKREILWLRLAEQKSTRSPIGFDAERGVFSSPPTTFRRS
jgi:hypothetical protein